jgi:hypothetical protein
MGENRIDFRHLRIYLDSLIFDDAGRHFLSRHDPLVETLIPDSAKSKFAACHSPASTWSVGRNMRETGGGGFIHSSSSHHSVNCQLSAQAVSGVLCCAEMTATRREKQAHQVRTK